MRSLIALVALALAAIVTPAHAQTSPTAAPTAFALPAGPIPKAFFGTGYTGHFVAALSNDDYSCNWALICEEGGAPDMHTVGADTMARTGGWAEGLKKSLAGPHGGTHMTFTFLASTFDANAGFEAGPAAMLAFSDFNGSVATVGLRNRKRQTFVSAATQGNSSFMALSQKHDMYFTAAFWASNVDVEALATCHRCTAAQVKTVKTTFLLAMKTLGGTADVGSH